MPKFHSIVRWISWSGAGALTMAASLWVAAAPVAPAEPVQTQPFNLATPGEKPLAITEAVPLILPYDFGDCDVLATVEVPAGGELDIVFRRVEPVGAHGRFGVLRMASTVEGPAFRRREAALFSDDLRGGVLLAAGVPASIRLELRGRAADAVVAGRRLPQFVADDEHGSLAFVVRGGEAAVRYLKVEPRAREGFGLWHRLGLAAAGLVVGLALARSRARPWRGAVGLLAVVIAGWLGRRWLEGVLVVGATPEVDSVVLLAGLALPLGLAIAFPGRARRTLLRCAGAAGIALLALEAVCRIEQSRLRAFEDARLDLYFGPESRQAPFGALARQLHGKNEVHSPRRASEQNEPRIVFLGGGPLFEANLDRAHHLAVQATARAAHTSGRPLRAAVVATAFPNTLQQILLYERFYADPYRPVAVVLGIDAWDALGEGPRSARQAMVAPLVDSPWCLLAALLRPSAPAVPLATPAELELTLDEFVAACRRRGTPLLLATHARIGAAELQVVERLATAQGVPLVRSVMSADDHADVEALATALVQLLR